MAGRFQGACQAKVTGLGQTGDEAAPHAARRAGDIIVRASTLYDRFRLRRVYYSAFSPIPDASAVLPLQRPPLMREHRLYQSDWLMRFYGFKPAEVVSAAESVGTERALRERSAAELSALAHAAHYTGRTALAVSAWTALRERFAGQKPARQAAFFIGRVHDQQGRTADALRWLNAYLSEAPADVYASEALGRKLAVVQKLQGRSAARPIAESYLARFPKGAYAQTAQALLSD